METGSSRVVVVAKPGGGWQLRETRDGPVLGSAATKHEIVTRAGLMLEQQRGGHIVLLAPDGSVERTLTVEPAGPRPWWYVRPGTWRWLLPLLLLPQVLRYAATWRTSPAAGVLAALGLVLLALCTWCLLRSRRLDRARRPVDVDPG